MENEEKTYDIIPVKGDTALVDNQKLEQAENEIDSIKKDLMDLTEFSREATEELIGLAKASQNPLYYDVLAKMIVATSKAGKEANETIKTKLELLKAAQGGDDPITSKVTNNHLYVTSNELIDMLDKDENK